MSRGATFGKYVLLRKLATGGMGEVFLAKQIGPSGFEKLLVIKRILAHHHDKHEYLDMFLSEAKLVARLTHSNIIQIHEMGQIDGDFFIAMEYLRGKSLRDIIDTLRSQGRQLPLSYVIDLAIKLCDGLGYAHNAKDLRGRPMNIIHRDVNPHNVLISYNGDLKLIDFGIAKSEMASVHTATGTIKGKFVYMSPEQSAADPIDRRSDIFSLGIVLYEMATLENPFVRQNVVLSLEAIQRHAVPSPEGRRADAIALAPILERALEKRSEDRYQNAEEMRDDLRDLFRSGAVKQEELDLSAFLNDLFEEDIEEEDRLLAEADQATSASPSMLAMTVPDLEDEEDITRRGRPPQTPAPRAPIPIDVEPFSDEEPTIAGDLDSIALRSRMKSGAGLPQPEPTGQILTLIPPEDVVSGAASGYDSHSDIGPSTREDRVPHGAPEPISDLVRASITTSDVPLDHSEIDEPPRPQAAIGTFQEPLSPSLRGFDPRQADTKEIRTSSSVGDFDSDISDTPVGVRTPQPRLRSDPPPRDPSVSIPAYAAPWRRSMVAAAALVFVLTAVAGYWFTRAAADYGYGLSAEPRAEPIAAPAPVEPVKDVVPAPDPAPPSKVAPAPAPKVAKADESSNGVSKKVQRRRARKAERRRVAERRRLKRRAAAVREAQQRAERQAREAADKEAREAADRKAAEAADAREAKANAERAKARAASRKKATIRRKARPAAAAQTPPIPRKTPETPPIPRTRTAPGTKAATDNPSKPPATGRRGIVTIRSSNNVKVEHAGRSAGSAPSSLVVRSGSGTIRISGPDFPVAIKLHYQVKSNGLSVGVDSKPWAIVKHNGISLGKTPQGPVPAGRRHRFSVIRPGQRTPLVVSLVWNPTRP